jgi:hypothetical protein
MTILQKLTSEVNNSLMRFLFKIPNNYNFTLDVNNYKGKKFQKYYISKLLEPPFTPKEDIHNKAQEFITNYY